MFLRDNPCEAALSAARVRADSDGLYVVASLRDYNKVSGLCCESLSLPSEGLIPETNAVFVPMVVGGGNTCFIRLPSVNYF